MAEKIFAPGEDSEISVDEINTLGREFSGLGGKRFVRSRGGEHTIDANHEKSTTKTFSEKLNDAVKENNIRWSGFRYDISTAREILQTKITDDEMVLLLKTLMPRLQHEGFGDEEVWTTLNFLHPTKHMAIVLDPEVGRYFRGDWSLINQRGDKGYREFLDSSIYQHYFPPIEFWEKEFEERPEDTRADRVFKIGKDNFLEKDPGGDVPAHVFYFTILRQLVRLDEYIDPRIRTAHHIPNNRELNRMKERLIGYLFSDPFMQHALPYLGTETEFPDDIIEMDIGSELCHVTVPIRSGEEAKEDKRKRFGEVLQAADAFLRTNGDSSAAERLKEREVMGIKFSDYLSHSS